MLTYTMDVLPESIWLRTTPGASAMGQPYVCTEAGQYLAQGHFSTVRTHKESYLLFYTLRGAGLIEQGDDRVLFATAGGCCYPATGETMLRPFYAFALCAAALFMLLGVIPGAKTSEVKADD